VWIFVEIQGQVEAYKEIDSENGHFIIISVSSNNYRTAQISSETQKAKSNYEINKGSG
jgi:hypothetical protein